MTEAEPRSGRIRELETSHEAMVTAPRDTAMLLDTLSRRLSSRCLTEIEPPD
jgi:hypothetical protein